jgi:superfamily II DNA or RNA helicase
LIEIIINGTTCKLAGEPISTRILQKLDSELSYKIDGAEFSEAYKSRGWDGMKRLLTKKLEFSYGLLDRVKEFLNSNDLEYFITDNRDVFKPRTIDITSRLKEINKVPYDYQQSAANIVFEKDCGIIRIATGGGKSLVCCLMVANLGRNANIYVIGKDLLYQLYDLFKLVFPSIKIGIIGDGLCEIGDINIISIFTAGICCGIDKKKIINDDFDDEKTVSEDKYDLIRQCLKKSKVHILDECQIVTAETINIIHKNINASYVYGMSATPYRGDNSSILISESILGKSIVDISASYLIDRGFLVQPIIKFIDVPKYKGTLPKTYQQIYTTYIVENEVRNKLIIDSTISLIEKGYKVLVLFDKIAHGNILYESLKSKTSCSLLSGKDGRDKRNIAKKELEDGIIKCIIVSRIFEVGVDIPCIDGLILASPTKSKIKTSQKIGRVIRKFEGKKHAAIYDFKDSAKFFKSHSEDRKKIYELEPKFKIIWPQKK